jgi:hypothetical protein
VRRTQTCTNTHISGSVNKSAAGFLSPHFFPWCPKIQVCSLWWGSRYLRVTVGSLCL